MNTSTPDPLELHFGRVVELPASLLWQAWTDPDLLKPWFTPAPWQTTECDIDLKPGGVFRTVMQPPTGKAVVNLGCYLEVVPHRRLVWTNALQAGFRPAKAIPADDPNAFAFTAVLTFVELSPSSTRYDARVLHADAAGRDRHAAMGFEDGWGTALDQLVASVASRS